MNESTKPPGRRIGLIRIRNHCTFTWQKPADSDQGTVEARANHCPKCLAEVQRLGYQLARPKVDGED
jgi:hypothetical protein